VSYSQDGGRHPIDVPSLAVGCIVWLPPKEENGKDVVCSCHGGKLDSQGYDHPVVVLKLQGVRENLNVSMCSVACITTFANTTLAEYHENSSRKPHFHQAIPISQTELQHANASTSPCLYVVKGAMVKQSYVKVKHMYEVPLSALRDYSRRYTDTHYLRLSKKSYAELMHLFHADGEPYEAAPNVVVHTDRGSRNSIHLPRPTLPAAYIPHLQINDGRRSDETLAALPNHVSWSNIAALPAYRAQYIQPARENVSRSYTQPLRTPPSHSQQTRLSQYTPRPASDYPAHQHYGAIPVSSYQGYGRADSTSAHHRAEPPNESIDGCQILQYLIGGVVLGAFIWLCYTVW